MPKNWSFGWLLRPSSCVEISKAFAVKALLMAMSMLPSHAPPMRPKAVGLAPASTTAIFIGGPICFAFTIPAAMIFCAFSIVIMLVELLIGDSHMPLPIKWFGSSSIFGDDTFVEMGEALRCSLGALTLFGFDMRPFVNRHGRCGAGTHLTPIAAMSCSTHWPRLCALCCSQSAHRELT